MKKNTINIHIGVYYSVPPVLEGDQLNMSNHNPQDSVFIIWMLFLAIAPFAQVMIIHLVVWHSYPTYSVSPLMFGLKVPEFGHNFWKDHERLFESRINLEVP